MAARDKQPPITLSPIADRAAEQAAKLGLPIEGKLLGLDHDGVRHAIKQHGGSGETRRGQVPVTAADFAAFPEIFNRATLRPGDPPYAPDGTVLIAGEAEFGDFRYSFVAKVRRQIVTVYSLWKRAL